MAMQSEMSKTYQYRKVVKPLLERKRRARINKCLDELKDLMVECLTQEGEHITRLEKADILELTVDHLRKLKFRKQQTMTDSFRSGYIQAANEVSKALAVTPGLDITLGTELMSHLGHRLNFIQTSVPPADRTPVVGSDTMYMPAPSPASSGYSSESEAGDQPATDNINNSGLSKEKMWRPW